VARVPGRISDNSSVVPDWLPPFLAAMLAILLLNVALFEQRRRARRDSWTAAAGMAYMVGGPRNLIGMIRYDQREEGNLKVGDRAPDVTLLELDGKTPVKLSEKIGGKPTVLVFASHT
jgi:hypothetical protein